MNTSAVMCVSIVCLLFALTVAQVSPVESDACPPLDVEVKTFPDRNSDRECDVAHPPSDCRCTLTVQRGPDGCPTHYISLCINPNKPVDVVKGPKEETTPPKTDLSKEKSEEVSIPLSQ